MVQLSILLPLMLASHIMSAAAVNCISDQSEDAQPIPAGPKRPGKTCLGGPPKGALWACQDPKIDFPTVECLTADIKTCGIINANNDKNVFYSFGVDKDGIGALRDRINPGGNIYNNILDDNYWKTVIAKRTDFKLGIRSRLFVFIARSAEAFSAACKGDVYVYVGQRKSKLGGEGAFQIPLPPNPGDGPNILRTYELPTLQRNSAVTRIISVDVSNNFQQTVDWENGKSPPGLNNVLLPESQASSLPVPIVPALRKSRRDGNATSTDVPILCPVEVATLKATKPASASSPPASMITSPPAVPRPSCVLHEQDPDQGIKQAFCLCNGKATLSPLSVPLTGHKTDSCAYTTIPATAKETVTTVASTYTKNCKACTQIGLNAPSCKSISKCTPTAAQVTVQVGTSSVHVGTLTGPALYTSVSSALEKLCPPVTQTKEFTACSTDSVIVPDIHYVVADSLETNGELVIKVQSGSYNSTTIRNAMIKSAALTAQTGSEKSTSCSSQSYETFVKRDTFPLSRIYNRRGGLFGLFAREHPQPVQNKAVFCNTAAFAGVGYFSPEWRKAQNPGAEAYIDTTWEFHAASGGSFLCNFIEELEVGLAVVAPEFAPEDIAFVPEIQAFCDQIKA